MIHRNDSTGTNLGDGLGDLREQTAHAGVEQQRLVSRDEELLKVNPAGGATSGYVGRKPVDAVSDLIKLGFHPSTMRLITAFIDGSFAPFG